MRAPAILLLLIVLLAVAAALWLFAAPSGEDSRPASDQEPVQPGAGAPATAALETVEREVLPAPSPAGRYAGVTDWKVLGRGLWLNSERPAAVERAIELLRGHPERMRELIRRIHPRFDTREDAGSAIVRGVAETLVRLGDPALDLLLEEIDDENAVYRTRVLALIGSFRTEAARVVPALIERFRQIEEDPPAGETASYINALAFIGPSAKALVPDLERWIDDGVTEEVEVAAINALVLIAGPIDSVFDRYREVLRASGWAAQRRAVLAQLGRLGAQASSMIPYLLELVDEGLLPEYSAMQTFGLMGVAHAAVLDRAERGLRAIPADAEGLGWHGYALARCGDAGMRCLMAFVEERGPRMRALLPPTLKQAGFAHDRILREVEAALTADDVLVRRAAWLNVVELDRLTPRAAEAALLRGLRDPDEEVRQMAIAASGAHAAPTRSVATALLERLEDAKENAQIRMEAAEVLVHRQPQPPERVYDALLVLDREHPQLRSSYLLHPWLRARTAVILRMWVKSAQARGWVRTFWPGLRLLPQSVRRQHADAIRTLGLDPETGEALKKAPR